MHASPAVRIGCTDCHGGDATAGTKEAAHVRPRRPELWPSSANPRLLLAAVLDEDPAFVRFVNPGDLRAAGAACAPCHPSEVRRVRRSTMATGAMFRGSILYDNGVFRGKTPRFGEAYARDGTPLRLKDADADPAKGQLPFLDPLPRFEPGQSSNALRVPEAGARLDASAGDEPDPIWRSFQATRILDPLLHYLGTNDHAGDYRSSGCSACHVVYANDRDPAHSGADARFGNRGLSFSRDPTLPKDEPGHPVRHAFSTAVPTSQCIVCHVHPGAAATNSFVGTIRWDNESEAESFYPKVQHDPTERERVLSLARNPDEAAARGLWSDPEFLAESSGMNPALDEIRLADFHGGGALYRNVYRRDRTGNLLDARGRIVSPFDPRKWERAVHLKDVHFERGMHCIDCHFDQDVHGDGHLHGSMRAAVEIACEDCHGTIRERARLVTSGPAAPPGGRDLAATRTPSGQRRFIARDGKIVQRSAVTTGLEWEVPQIADGATRNPASWRAKTIQRDNEAWGDPAAEVAHDRARMTCYSCHTSWTTSCSGCHLPTRANQRLDAAGLGRDLPRTITPFDPQSIRADTFMLAVDGDATGNRIAPARSACAVMVGVQDARREWSYSQQQTISAEGFSGNAFATHVPHTVRGRETKRCDDCHLAESGDNNAILAQLLTLGTGFTNFIGRRVYVGTDTGLEAVTVTERDEPQAVIGSSLHKRAFPKNFRDHALDNYRLQDRNRVQLRGTAEPASSVQLRGEYLYVANGAGGFRVFHVADLEHPTAPRRGETKRARRLRVPMRDAACVAVPTTLLVDPTRARDPANREQAIHPAYGYLYVADAEEGLVLLEATTLLDRSRSDDAVSRVLAFNPDGRLKGARYVAVAGRFAYVGCDGGLVVVDLDRPLEPRIAASFPDLEGVRGVQVQFRYAFVACAAGLVAVDVTPEADGSFPAEPRAVSAIPLPDARQVAVARTYAYVAAGAQGLAIVDITRPESMRLVRIYDADGALGDCCDVKIGLTNVSLFAYVADGRNGLRVLQLTEPGRDAQALGFSPPPDPRLIATAPTKGRALSISCGLDRDRAVDEAGNQIAVFGRVGERPLTFAEMQRLLRLPDGRLFFVR